MNADTSTTSDFGRNTPSRLTLTFSLNTTVPINVVGSDIGGRHTPTKQALRHSRMIAMSRSGKNRTGHLSIIIKHPSMVKYFVCLQSKLALVVILISAWMVHRMPDLKHRDIPYWSGGFLLISGLLNSVFLCCCRRVSSNDSSLSYPFYPKIFSLVVTTLAALTCLCATVFALIHIYVIKIADCQPLDEHPSSSCVCRVPINALNENDATNIIDIVSQNYRYSSLDCDEVTSVLAIAMIASAVTNTSGIVACLYYVFLHKTGMYSEYSQVPSIDSPFSY